MDGSILYTRNLELMRMGTRRIVNQGGQWSGKTVNILAALATLCAEETPSGTEPIVTTVTAQSFPHLKGGALRDFETFVYPEFKSSIKQYHKTDHLFTFHSGMALEFKSFENEMAARGSKRKRLFVNEANTFDYMVWFQLDSRAEQSIIDYNPSARFWSHEKIIGQPGTELIISDHRHNPFLTEAKHKEIEGYTGELFKVYSRGLTGNVTGVIFPNWEMIDDDDFPKESETAEPFTFSIDFGYTVDPTCIIKQVLIGDTLYVKELSYAPGLSPLEIMLIMRANGYVDGVNPFFCEWDKDMIRDLRHHGASYAMPATKGPGSIKAGIALLNRWKVKYTCSSQNLHRERSVYVYEVDKVTQLPTNMPIDRHNHCFDAIRYGAYTRYLKTY